MGKVSIKMLIRIILVIVSLCIFVWLWGYGKNDVKKAEEITKLDMIIYSIFYDGYMYVEKENYISCGAITAYLADKYDFEPETWGVENGYICRICVKSYWYDLLHSKELNTVINKYNDELINNLPTDNPSQKEIVDAIGKTVRQSMCYDMTYEGKGKVLKLKKGRGYCFDYAFIIKELCDYHGITCEYVVARCEEEQTYHIFNTAYIDGKWIYLDGTSLAFVPSKEEGSLDVGDVRSAGVYPELYALNNL